MSNTGQDAAKTATTTTPRRKRKERQRRGAAEKCREAVIITDRRFQDNITALKGAAASRCKHPKLAARRAAAYEKSLMSTMLAAGASDTVSQTRREGNTSQIRKSHRLLSRSVYSKLLLMLTASPAECSAALLIGWSGLGGHAPRGFNQAAGM